MRLFELTNPPIPKVIKHVTRKNLDNFYRDPDDEFWLANKTPAKNYKNHLGSGAFAFAIKGNKRNIVYKFSHNPQSPEEDGYYKYLKHVILFYRSGGKNPYFPKVYVMTERHNKRDDAVIYKVTTERLFHLEKMSDSVKARITKKALGRETTFGTLLSEMSIATRTGNFKFIKDERLVHALTLIKNIYHTYDLTVDLHEDNVMVRPGTFHLVITDPLS